MLPLNDAMSREARRLQGDWLRGTMMHAAYTDLLGEMQGVLNSLTVATSKTVVAFLQGVRQGVPSLKEEIGKVHAQVAAQAQVEILKAYDQSLKGTPAYRKMAYFSRNRRYAGGILRSVLASEGFVSYDDKGVYIGDTRRLDAMARQWRRLNYGAGGAAGGGAEIFTVKWGSQEFTIGEPGGKRPAFRIPQGAWFGQEFYPTSEILARHRIVSQMTGRRPSPTIGGYAGEHQKSRMTRGIEGKHWLAAGIEVVAENLPKGYTAAINTLWKAGDEGVRKLVDEAGISRPGQPKVTVRVSARSPQPTRANIG